MTRALSAALLVVSALAVTGCAPEITCEERGDMLVSPSGLVLEQGEHEAGWGERDCTLCHPSWTYHQINCTTFADMDLQQMWEGVDPEDTESCMECHGANGVDP